jgi:hypothetical protein
LIALVALAALVIGGLGGVAQLKFSAFLSESVRERLEIVAATTAQDFEAAIDLGLRIDSIANGPVILDRALAHDPNIESIVVFDRSGRVLHSTGSSARRSSVGAETVEAFRLASEGITDPVWRVEDDVMLGSGIVIEGGFGQAVAGLQVDYPKTEMQQQAAVMANNLTRDAAIVTVALGTSMAILLVILRRRSTPATVGELS